MTASDRTILMIIQVYSILFIYIDNVLTIFLVRRFDMVPVMHDM